MGNICSCCKQKEEEDEDDTWMPEMGITEEEFTKLIEDEQELSERTGPDGVSTIDAGHFLSLDQDFHVNDWLTEDKIRLPYLKQVFLGDTDRVFKELDNCRPTNANGEKRQYKEDVEWDTLLTFWFAIDQGNIKVVNQMISVDLQFRYIAVLAMRKIKEFPKKYKKASQKPSKTSDKKSKEKSSGAYEGGMNNDLSSSSQSSSSKAEGNSQSDSFDTEEYM